MGLVRISYLVISKSVASSRYIFLSEALGRATVEMLLY